MASPAHALIVPDAGMRPDPLRAKLRRAYLAAGLLAAAWPLAALARGDHHLYEPAPVAPAHGAFGADCARCHTTRFAPVPDAACLACHADLLSERAFARHAGEAALGDAAAAALAAPAARGATGLADAEIDAVVAALRAGDVAAVPAAHLARVVAEVPDGEKAALLDARAASESAGAAASASTHYANASSTPACRDCHREHRPARDLDAVADGRCVACHADLPASGLAVGAALAVVASDGARIATFSPTAHPELGARRASADAPPLSSSRLAPDGQDRTPIRLNHALHAEKRGFSGQHLQCTSCHEPDAAGDRMRPPTYARHCRACHAISVPAPFARDDAATRAALLLAAGYTAERFVKELETSPDDLAPAELREMLESLVERKLELPDPVLDVSDTHGVSPARTRELVAALARDAGADEAARDRALDALFPDRRTETGKVDAMGACVKCHAELEGWGPAASPPPAIARPADWPSFAAWPLVGDWAPSARFRHESHRPLACAACHARAAGGPDGSRASSDVLLPGIATCATCHHTGGARSACVTCHDYHDRGRAPAADGGDLRRSFDGSRAAEDLFR